MPTWLSVVVRLCHILPIIIAVGGTIFMRLVLLPAARRLPPEHRQVLRTAVVGRFGVLLWACITLLIASGVIQLVNVIGAGVPTAYHAVIGIKIILALVLFTIAFGLTLPGETFAPFRQHAPLFLAINVILGTTIVILSAILRQMH